jgi:hypothetical protein
VCVVRQQHTSEPNVRLSRCLASSPGSPNSTRARQHGDQPVTGRAAGIVVVRHNEAVRVPAEHSGDLAQRWAVLRPSKQQDDRPVLRVHGGVLHHVQPPADCLDGLDDLGRSGTGPDRVAMLIGTFWFHTNTEWPCCQARAALSPAMVFFVSLIEPTARRLTSRPRDDEPAIGEMSPPTGPAVTAAAWTRRRHASDTTRPMSRALPRRHGGSSLMRERRDCPPSACAWCELRPGGRGRQTASVRLYIRIALPLWCKRYQGAG